MEPQQVAQAFTQHFYNIFDSDRRNLEQIYRPESVLSWEGKVYQGKDAIVKHLVNLPFKNIVRKIDMDFQPTLNGIMIFIVGTLAIDGEAKALKYAQTFNLVLHQGQYLLLNDFFRLALE
ncbi:hypothetical protein CYY_001834 [Polysphondylium violaceum]|uniref:NTF2 domain-containing protein n=1 Tax=Polysphondylium violaceum TaxID=133409 RepID=A0A8J4Q189_9MYCE|nr:hypothetical protein CYY_001834 [Polysphondylium violaceum]